MSRQFIYSRKDGSPSKPAGFARVMMVAALKIVQGIGPFRVKLNDEDAGPKRQRIATLRKLRERTRAGEVGMRFRVFLETDLDPDTHVPLPGRKALFWVREIKPALVIEDTSGNDKIDIVWSAIKQAFQGISFLGAYVCKTIIGSGGVMSQHSYGNAVDIGAATMAILEEIAHWAVARADQLHLEHVIVGSMIWTRGQGWHHYDGEYHYHVHLDCDPNFTGPCGVRN